MKHFDMKLLRLTDLKISLHITVILRLALLSLSLYLVHLLKGLAFILLLLYYIVFK